MVGAYVPYLLQRAVRPLVGQATARLLPAGDRGLVRGHGAAGAAAGATLIRHLYGRPLDTLLATWGVGLVLQQAARSIFGAPNVQVTSPPWLTAASRVGARFAAVQAAVHHRAGDLLRRRRSISTCTARQGRRMRAVDAEPRDGGLPGRGDPPGRRLTFALGSGLAGVAGCALTLLGPDRPVAGHLLHRGRLHGGGAGRRRAAAGHDPGGAADRCFEHLRSSLEHTATVGKVLVFVLVIAFLQWRPAGLVALRTR